MHTLVLMRAASSPAPAARSHSREQASPLQPQMQRGGCWRPVGTQHLCAVLPHRVCALGLASALRCCRQSARASALYLVCRRWWFSRRLSARYLVCLRRWCCFRLSARGSARYLVYHLHWCCCHLGARASACNLVCRGRCSLADCRLAEAVAPHLCAEACPCENC
jgi:hypothetical protein